MKQVNFGKIKSPIDPPLLLGMQRNSFADFLQRNVPPEKRKAQGLEMFSLLKIQMKVWKFNMFPIHLGNLNIR